MDSLILIAAGIPFVIILLAATVLAVIRYRLTESHLKVLILGITLNKAPLSGITRIEYIPSHSGQPWNFFHRGGTVIVEYDGPKGQSTMALSPRDAEEFAKSLRESVRELTGREV